MENPIFINTVNDNDKKSGVEKHERSQEHFETHRKMYEEYAGFELNIKPAPPNLDTFAFDLETNIIYLTDKFYKLLGYPEEGTAFATFHEIEHFREKVALLKEKNGDRVFADYLNKLDEKVFKYAGAYGVMDNCISDIRQNGAVIKRNTNEGYLEVERNLYKNVQFPSVDFNNDKEENGKVVSQKQPLHIQLPYALLNEYRSERECVVDERVREIIKDLQNFKKENGEVIDLVKVMTDPSVSMSKRLAIQDNFIWPKVLELLEEDIKEKEEKKKNKKNNDGKDEENKEKGEGKEGDERKEINPNEEFSDYYKEAKKRVPNAVPIEKQKESLKKWVEENSDPEKKKNKEVAERLDVKLEDLKRYKDIVKDLEQIKNPKTNESVVSELYELLNRIISHRLKEKHAPKYPVEEGDDLIDPAGWFAEVKGGNYEPKVWEDTEIKLQKDKKFGEVEITLIGDRSYSMNDGNGEKRIEQQRAFVLLAEVLKMFNDKLEDEDINLEKSLFISSEFYTFQKSDEDKKPIKKMGKGLSDKERIDICTKVNTTPGESTPDYIPLEEIDKNIDKDTIEKIKEGELKKILIIFTDGGSDDEAKVQEALKSLKEKGVVIVCIGITESGKPAIKTYAPFGRLAEKAEDLSVILAEVLKEHLSDI